MKRPKRKRIPVAVRKMVCSRQSWLCPCGCGQVVYYETKSNTEFDHEPALALRDVNEAGTDYVPPQLDPDYIVARCPDSHLIKTSGSGATTAGTDIGKIKKQRKREKAMMPQRFKRRIPSRPFRRRET